jgi:hypothetical protein
MPGSNLGQDIASDDFVVLLSPSRKTAVYDLEIGHENFLCSPLPRGHSLIKLTFTAM